MKRPAIFSMSIAIAAVAGFYCARLLLPLVVVREEIAKVFDRGRLVALVNGRGIYEVDVSRKVSEATYAAGILDEEPVASEWRKSWRRVGAGINANERNIALEKLVVNSAAQSDASHESVSGEDLKRQMSLLRSEFGNDKAWNAALSRSGLSRASISTILENDLKTRRWVSKRIAGDVSTTAEECRKFYDSHLDEFFLPERRNVSHLFLAAPPETPPDVTETKKTAIEALSARLAAGEDFATLVAQNSEDDATKLRGGELGYFSAKRMPPDFVEAATKLKPGEISKPVRTRLGFHILKLIDVQQARQQTFDEVRNDIAVEIENQKRQIAVQNLSGNLGAAALYFF